jgi:heme/copper-type cytochrome/quinol oxidase subunit 1
LRGDRREDELALSLRRNPPVPPRGEWNDWGYIANSGANLLAVKFAIALLGAAVNRGRFRYKSDSLLP